MQDSRADAIVALATAPLAAERAVLRLSVPDMRQVAEAAQAHPSLRGLFAFDLAARGVIERSFDWADGLLVAVQLWNFPGPRSATGEDLLEFHLLGSLPIVRAFEAALLEVEGVRAAEPGEFTRRAFLSGVLDLTQAEAVQALVQSQDAAEALAAAALLTGALAGDLQVARDALTDAMVQIEAGLDFEEGDSQDLQPGEIEATLATAKEAIARGQAEEQGRSARTHGRFRIGLIGEPNAGKTALFRRLTGATAIVADEQGTTRDRLEAPWAHEGHEGPEWWLADGPGRSVEALDARDSAAQDRARHFDHFDLVLEVVDASDPHADLLACRMVATPCCVLFAKSDRPRAIADAVVRRAAERGSVLWISAEKDQGLDALRREVAAVADLQARDRRAAARASVRHQQALRRAAEAVDAAGKWDAVGGHQDLVAEELRNAMGAIAELVGEFTPEDLLDQLFSSFCVGK
ncbi:MAG: 50S ribosome-binding GTPase [Planctomycetes bacterium]|nr:50S ribosome-binding GTPase [Planctomycetota bacterium]